MTDDGVRPTESKREASTGPVVPWVSRGGTRQKVPRVGSKVG